MKTNHWFLLIALLLATEGARVVLTDVNEREGQAVAETIAFEDFALNRMSHTGGGDSASPASARR